ncbi:hypothetical protein KC340_g1691 [Hortaea werneckii]|nr:hypothetical protein KC342_g1642 [Hortaea werneckii]KAI7105847.1 hypothetical protein KC339_g3524 [Hortaea werneckii]KAI7245045.1 hypothetical protein KC365_g843 [Hortaea werneckii]KAI7336426.1 hypothetical protein KC340_g1691 [Hortaea werneckii]KAI7407354.1 hypothetical protein KC328_g551 [Hortaea werneckii]
MTAEFDQMLGSFSANRPQHAQMDHDVLVGLDKQLIASGWTPVPSATNPLPSPVTPTSRLAGEPAFCAGRHCCQWSDGSYVCNNHYPSAEDLDRHVAQDHAGKLPSGQPSGEYHCHWAGCSKTESFGNKPKLTRHIHSHTGHKPHQCRHPGCGKGFVTKEQLKNHETTHTKTKQHVCPECGKGFAVKTALTSHMNVHRGTKPYICDECGKGFADSSNLSKHKAIHKRAALKKSHSRRQSACTSCHDSALASPSLMGPPHGMATTFGSPYLPDFPAPSIEAATADMLPPEYCGLPCFDTHCNNVEKVPSPIHATSPIVILKTSATSITVSTAAAAKHASSRSVAKTTSSNTTVPLPKTNIALSNLAISAMAVPNRTVIYNSAGEENMMHTISTASVFQTILRPPSQLPPPALPSATATIPTRASRPRRLECLPGTAEQDAIIFIFRSIPN